MRIALHTVLLRADWRWGYLPVFRGWLWRVVNWTCPAKRGERCPLWPATPAEIV
jgi:hypothetical protein